MRERRVDAEGAELACWIREGTSRGRWLVMLHGAGLDHREFLDVVDLLDESWGIVLCDLRGHGRSRLRDDATATLDAAIDDLDVVLRDLDISSCVLVGHSFGGNIAQEYTHRRPERAAALVMVGSPGQHRVPRRGELALTNVVRRVYERVPWSAFARFTGRWSSREPATRAYVRDCLIATGRRTYLDLALSGVHSVHPSPSSALPTLLVRGEHDMPRALDDVFAALEQSGSDVTRVVIRAAGHQVMHDDPAGFAAALQAFLDGHPQVAP